MNSLAYQALRERAAWIDLSGRGKIRASGEDRARLLHAMTTNHVQQLTPGKGCYAFFLSAQGRILSDVNLFCLPEYLLLDTEPESLRRVYEHLDKFIIADDVTLEDVTEHTATVNLEGPEAEQMLEFLKAPIPESEHGIEAWGDRLVARVTSTGVDGFSIFVPADQKADLVTELESAGAIEADAETADVVRIECGKPRYGKDITDALIPQETQQMQALSFVKGCYVGQEIVERVRSRGHVNKVLAPMEIETEEDLDAGVKIVVGGKDVGEITSAAFSPSRNKVVALGIIRVEALDAKDLTANGARVTPTAVPASALK
jgi:folate-binding protein YgfZ